MDMSNVKNGRIQEFEKMFRMRVKKWISLPKDCPDALIHGSSNTGGLGIRNIERSGAKRKLDRYDRINNKDDDPYRNDSQVEVLRKLIPVPVEIKHDEMTEYEKTDDGRAMKSHKKRGYKSKWIRNPPAWIKSNFLQKK